MSLSKTGKLSRQHYVKKGHNYGGRDEHKGRDTVLADTKKLVAEIHAELDRRKTVAADDASPA